MQFARIAAVAAALGLTAVAPRAGADVTHVVARGHTLTAIAHRYHVTVKAIMTRNHIKDARHLRIGRVLVIPGVNPTREQHGHGAKASHGHTRPHSYATRAKTPGVVHLKRLATDEKATVRLLDRRRRVPPTALKRMRHMMRYPDGETHAIDGRLLALLAIVSDHFGSRPIEIISGFRPYRPTQYTPHSKHNIGHAVDFRVVGVPNEAVRDFCRTLHNTGCGYYPNSVFVHMDSRSAPAYWVDYARPGEPPKYDKPNSGADESGSDVANEQHIAAPKEPDGAAADPSRQGDSPPPDAKDSDDGKTDTPANAPADGKNSAPPPAASASGSAATPPPKPSH